MRKFYLIRVPIVVARSGRQVIHSSHGKSVLVGHSLVVIK